MRDPGGTHVDGLEGLKHACSDIESTDDLKSSRGSHVLNIARMLEFAALFEACVRAAWFNHLWPSGRNAINFRIP